MCVCVCVCIFARSHTHRYVYIVGGKNSIVKSDGGMCQTNSSNCELSRVRLTVAGPLSQI